jgi:ketosteroid isomerase-like protein
MSQENVEVVRRGYAHFQATGSLLEEIIAPGFVWDMSTFKGWPEQSTYEGIEGARRFLADWTEPFEDWRLEVEQILDGGESVVVLLRQSGRSKLTGMTVEMSFGQLWAIRDGQQSRVAVYASHAETLDAAGLPA